MTLPMTEGDDCSSRDHAPSITAVTSGQTHTPGPWVWTDGYDPIDINTYKSPGYYRNPELKAGDDYIIGCDEYWILGPCDDQDQMRANARLIAAAPELLEALKFFVEVEERWLAGDPVPAMELDQPYETALAAIAKAEGRAPSSSQDASVAVAPATCAGNPATDELLKAALRERDAAREASSRLVQMLAGAKALNDTTLLTHAYNAAVELHAALQPADAKGETHD